MKIPGSRVTLPQLHADQLDREGYLLLERACDDATFRRLKQRIDELFVEEGELSGSEFKLEEGSRRLANLVDKGDIFEDVIVREDVLAYVRHILGHQIKLSSLNVRSVNPNSEEKQPLHADMRAIPDSAGFWVANLVWMLDDFTADNGALRIVPGSHAYGKLPQDVLADPIEEHPDEVLVTGNAGDVIVLNAHTWHGGLPNRTSKSRTALHAFYCRRDKQQQQYQKALIRDEVQCRLTPAHRHLLALDDLLNDQLSQQDVRRSGFLR
jgi:ectoine hydroxylase-related dioxygenase (phytanoyl-CoA dioxygenase family)